MTLGELITNYRSKHGLSQRQFALACGVSNGYISMIEKNLNPKTGLPLVPSIPALRKIAFGMGLALSDLFSMVDDMPMGLSDYTNNTNEKVVTGNDDKTTSEINYLFDHLPDNRKSEALNYLHYLSKLENNS